MAGSGGGPLRRIDDIDWQCWKATDPATLVFVIKDGHVLLIRKKRGLGAGKINGPGGRVEPGESAEQCALREVAEELCVRPLRISWRGEHRFQFVDGYAIHVQVFVAPDLEGEPRETAEARPLWTPLDAIPYDEMWEDDRLWLPQVIAGGVVRGRFLFDGDSMLDYQLEVDPGRAPTR